MLAPLLLSLILASAAADGPPDAAALFGRLGAASFDDRVAALKALERLGVEALPALRSAADSADARVRTRARALIESIGRQAETDRFARSTMIRLDFRDRPLGEIVDALNERHDLGLTLRLGPEPRRGMIVFDRGGPDRLKALKGREVTLENARPLPFWEAIDRLCDAAALRYDASPRAGFGNSPGYLVLMADRTGRGPVSDSGPFRVQISGVQAVFERDFTRDPDPAGPGAKPAGAGDLTLPLAVLPEPGLILHPNGAVIVTEATDDRGRSMVPKAPAQPDSGRANQARPVNNGRASIQVNAALDVPDPPGTTIRRLRGKVPVVAVSKGSDPVVIPLKGEGVEGKVVSTRQMTLVVDQVSLAPGAPASVQVTFRYGQNPRAFARPGPARPDYSAFNRDRALEHLELHDASGRRLDHTLGLSMRGADGQGFYDRYRLVVAPVVEDGPADGPKTSRTPIPSELRYYGFVQSVMEVPFDFRDVPMP